MSIWTELLFLHGHVATPIGLALVAPVAPRGRPAAGPARREAPAAERAHHPLRSVGQLR